MDFWILKTKAFYENFYKNYQFKLFLWRYLIFHFLKNSTTLWIIKNIFKEKLSYKIFKINNFSIEFILSWCFFNGLLNNEVGVLKNKTDKSNKLILNDDKQNIPSVDWDYWLKKFFVGRITYKNINFCPI